MADSNPPTASVDLTGRVSLAVAEVKDPLWQLELAAHCAMPQESSQNRRPDGSVIHAIAQCLAAVVALTTLIGLTLRYGGTSPVAARKHLKDQRVIFAVHAEDSTRTRHLRTAIGEFDEPNPAIALLGRPAATTPQAARRFDPRATLGHASYIRPLSLRAVLSGLPEAVSLMMRGVRETAAYCGALSFRDRVAINFRMALGAAQSRWWRKAAQGLTIETAIFGHTGTADTSQLELSMQRLATRTVHAVHGTNLGWPFAGLSDVGLFQSGADARLGAKLPDYGSCTHLSIPRPSLQEGNGGWALLTSYTHLHHPAFAAQGAQPDCDVVEWMRVAAERLGQDPQRILWRPHPQITLVPAQERERLERAVSDAGFTRWPDHLPYDALGRFSVAVTTPSTVLTDGLRLGQPVIVANLTPLQRDVLYTMHPLLADNQDGLVSLMRDVLDPQRRQAAFEAAWNAIEPGAALNISRVLKEV